MFSFGVPLGIVGTIVALVVGWLITRFYYKRTYQDLQEIRDSLESQHLASIRLLGDGSDGELIKNPNGKWSIRWKRTLSEQVGISEQVNATVKKVNESSDV